MKYLAIDCSGANLTALVDNGESVYKFFDASCGVSHSTTVMPVIENLLIESGASLADLDFIACVTGAGSFTGIRIGVATAKALAMANRLKVLPITSFDVLAYNITARKILAVIDAKHDGFYVCGYTDGEISYQPKYINKQELIELAKEYQLVASQEIADFNVLVADMVAGLEKAINAKKDLAIEDINGLEPLYCRKSQAEEGR